MRTAALVLVGVAALLASPASAMARDIGPDDEVVITGTVRVPRGEHVDRIVIVDGRVDIEGHVEGVVFALDAPVHIGRRAVIDGDVVAGARPVTLEPGATLNQDLIYVDDKPVVPRGVTIYGEVRRVGSEDFAFPDALLLHAALWLAFTLSTLALGLLMLWLAPGVASAAFEVARERAGPAIAWGLGLFVGLPVAALVAVLTLVGIPLGAVVLLALFPLYALGYVASAYVLGRRSCRTRAAGSPPSSPAGESCVWSPSSRCLGCSPGSAPPCSGWAS